MDVIQEFSAERGVVLDDFQVQAAKALIDGCSVLVAAPTGSGKTLVADFAAFIARPKGTTVIYTTPIKALSNQKFAEFCELYGEANVGLATGDRSIRPKAPIRIMTTEVLRNIIYAQPQSLDNVSHVILDEVHYISDRSRGAVWEEVIIQLPLEIDLVCLSATVSNAEEVAQWLTTVRGSTQAIIHETRSVPLTYWFSFRKRRQGLQVMPLLSHSDAHDVSVHPDLYRVMRPRGRGSDQNAFLAPRRMDLIDYLEASGMIPAIFFIFSRAGCDSALHECFNSHASLTNATERKAIREICDRHLEGLSNDEFDALDYDIITHAMERGFAPHHAGLIPPLREAVEEAFVRGLVKVVFATETLAVGVNMPAKTVVIEKLTKFNGDHHDILTPGEFTQLTGRAGRRGIDVAGHAIVQWNRFIDFEQAAALASTRSYALRSSFRPTYNMAANLITLIPRCMLGIS
jgi:ATP-dependent RNA helicase HelY